MDRANWAWGLSLIVLTIAIHATAVVTLALVDLGVRLRIETREDRGLLYVFMIVIGVIGLVGLALAAVHGMEAAVWAGALVWLGALNSLPDAMLYSLDSMTTRGASGLSPDPHWRLIGALEAADGMLLFGISTAYIFAVMQTYWPLLSKRLVARRGSRS